MDSRPGFGVTTQPLAHTAVGASGGLRFDLPHDRVAGWSLRTPLERLSGARLARSAIGAHATDYEVVLLMRSAASRPVEHSL